MRILAIDPGKTTGVCLLETTSQHDDFEVALALEIPWEAHPEFLWALINGTLPQQRQPHPPEVVVVEAFRLRQGRALEQTGSDFPSSQVIGMIQMVLWLDRPYSIGSEAFFPGPNPKAYVVQEAPNSATTVRPVGISRLAFQQPATISRVQIDPRHLDFVQGSAHKQDAYKHARFFYLAHIRSKL